MLKLSFNRPKDWVDIQAMLDAGIEPDVGYVREQLLTFRGPTMHPRIGRFLGMIPSP